MLPASPLLACWLDGPVLLSLLAELEALDADDPRALLRLALATLQARGRRRWAEEWTIGTERPETDPTQRPWRALRGSEMAQAAATARRRGHNEGSIYVVESKQLWAAVLSLPDGKRRYLYAKAKKDVQAKLRKAQQDRTTARRSRPTGRRWASS